MKLKKGIVVHNFGDSYVAYDTQKSLMHELNESGYFILNEIIGNKNSEQIIKKMVKEFEIGIDQANFDFTQFLEILKSMDVIE